MFLYNRNQKTISVKTLTISPQEASRMLNKHQKAELAKSYRLINTALGEGRRIFYSNCDEWELRIPETHMIIVKPDYEAANWNVEIYQYSNGKRMVFTEKNEL